MSENLEFCKLVTILYGMPRPKVPFVVHSFTSVGAGVPVDGLQRPNLDNSAGLGSYSGVSSPSAEGLGLETATQAKVRRSQVVPMGSELMAKLLKVAAEELDCMPSVELLLTPSVFNVGCERQQHCLLFPELNRAIGWRFYCRAVCVDWRGYWEISAGRAKGSWYALYFFLDVLESSLRGVCVPLRTPSLNFVTLVQLETVNPIQRRKSFWLKTSWESWWSFFFLVFDKNGPKPLPWWLARHYCALCQDKRSHLNRFVWKELEWDWVRNSLFVWFCF